MRGDEAVTESFTLFVKDFEPRLRYALVAAFGPERGLESASDALAYGWEHWDRVAGMENPAGYLYRLAQRRARRRRRSRVVFPSVPLADVPWAEPAFQMLWLRFLLCNGQ